MLIGFTNGAGISYRANYRDAPGVAYDATGISVDLKMYCHIE